MTIGSEPGHLFSENMKILRIEKYIFFLNKSAFTLNNQKNTILSMRKKVNVGER